MPILLFFDAAVNGIFLLISLSDISLVKFKYATEFCVLIFVSCNVNEFVY